jgi:hypothetical protein
MKKTPDQVCAEAPNVKFSVKRVRRNEAYVLIEGNKAAFEFLSKLFAAHAEFSRDCGFEIGPDGSGNSFFKRGAKLGLYLHRLPCVEKMVSKSRLPSHSL